MGTPQQGRAAVTAGLVRIGRQGGWNNDSKVLHGYAEDIDR
ncbi:hypothetical protein [Streptomyces longwoodensis]